MKGSAGKHGRIWEAPRPVQAVLVCGMKSASTWLGRRLEEHEGICYVKGQDLVFDFDEPSLLGFRRKVQPLDGQMLVSRRNLSEAVLRYPYAAAFHRHNPETKLVSLLREPVSRTLSNIQHTIRKYPIHQWPETFRKAAKRAGFGQVFLDTDALMAQELDKPDRERHSVGISSFYNKCLSPFLERFPKEQFLILPLEPQMKDLTKVLPPIYDFLELAPLKEESDPSAAEKANVSRSRRIGLFETFKGFRKVEVSEPSAACLDVLRAAFLEDARRLDAEFGTSAVDLWQLEDGLHPSASREADPLPGQSSAGGASSSAGSL